MESISIIDVERAWRENSEARALGGRRALSGFSYQIYLSLSRYFRAVAAGNPAGAFAFEGLSDLAEERQGLTYLTQVKSTLSLEALKSAAAEALEVDRFLEDRWPELRDAYRYQVIGRHSKGSLPEITEIPPDSVGLQGAAAERWMRVRERFGSVSIQPDPYLDLAIFLFPQVSKTFSFVDEATGKLLALLGQDRPSDEIANALLELLDASRVDEAPPGEVLGPHSWNTTALDGPLVLVGERPTIEDVAASRFMERPRRVNDIIQQIHEIRLASRSNLATVVWLDGTSGVGKSVLLLQVLRALTFQEGSVVHWLQHFPHRLAEALGYWQEQPARALIGIDDLYSPDHRSLSEVWNAFYETTATGDWPMGRPLLITAGPSEYREAFEDQAHRRGSLAVQRIEVEALGPVERDEVRKWYGQRTGWAPPAIAEENFVSHVFTYEVDRLRETPGLHSFAARLKERLVELEILDATRSALALNRLGLLAPEELFVHAAGTLDQLQREGILRARRLESAVGLRLFHATIADTLYMYLRPVERVVERAIDLVRPVEALLPDQDRARDLLDALSKTKNRKQLGRELHAQLALNLWRSIEQIEPPSLPMGLLFSLFDDYLDVLKSRAGLVARRLKSWMVHDQMDDQGWGILFQFMTRIAPQRINNNALNKAELVLEEQVDWPGWNYLWQAAWRHRPTPTLVDLAHRWLARNPSERGWGYVFQLLFEHDPKLPGLDAIARSGLKNSPVSPADLHIWRKAATLLDASELAQLITSRLVRTPTPRIRDQGLRFLLDELQIAPGQLIEAMGRSSGEDHYLLLLRDVLDRQEEDLLDSVAASLSGHEDRPEWPHVWRRLTELRPDDAQFFHTGYRWLTDREDRPEWSHVWQKLIELRPDDDELFDTGYRWLTDREDRPEWNYVWQRLTELSPDDDELFDAGYRWLGDREDQPEWNFVWQRLIELQPDHAGLFDTGYRWLKDREDRPEWNYVWQRLIELRPDDDELFDTGYRWLTDREDRSGWNYVWQRLTELSPDDDELFDTGYRWLTDREDRPEWNYVWQRLTELSPDDDELLDTGYRWLTDREDRPEWSHVWRRLIELRPDDAGLYDTGYRWLTDREDRPEWSHVWQRLIELRPDDDELFDAGYRWLGDREDQPEWNFVWQRLIELQPTYHDLEERGVAWLENHLEDPGWPWVWEALVRHRGSRHGLTDLAHRWLEACPKHPKSGVIALRIKGSTSKR